jgi:mono/diheme cytochrome c family protein
MSLSLMSAEKAVLEVLPLLQAWLGRFASALLAYGLGFFAGMIGLTADARAQDAPNLPESIQRFLGTHCRECHGDSPDNNSLNVSALMLVDGEVFERLVRVFDRVHQGEMPPKTEPKIDPSQKAKFEEDLKAFLTIQDRERIRRDGRAMMRRLNRYEYENTLRDLLNLPWIQIRNMLPEDGELYRYNKSGEALDVSHVQLARYMSAADHALRQAMLVQFERPAVSIKRFYARDEPSLVGNFWPRENGTLPDRLSFPVLDSRAQPDVRSGRSPWSSPETREREAVGKVSSIFSDAGSYSWGQFRVPASGRYKLRFKGYAIWVSGGGIGRWFYEGFGDEKAPVYHLPLWHRPNADEVWPGRRSEPIGVYAQSSGKSRSLGQFDFGVQPTECEIHATLVANEVIQTDGLRLFRTRVNGTDEQYVNPLATEAGMPGYAIQWMEAEGPLDDDQTGAGYRLLFGEMPLARVESNANGGLVLQIPPKPAPTPAPSSNSVAPSGTSSLGEARTSRPGAPGSGQGPAGSPRLGGPQRRGFGAPRLIDVRVEVVTDTPRKDAERLLRNFLARVYREPIQPAQAERFLRLFEHEYEQGVGFASAMLSVYTAVLASPGFLFVNENPGPLSDDAIATRLGLFLWNSEPDLTLRSLAQQGKIRNKDVLHEQVERMLTHSSSSRFVEAFTDYWLDLRKVDDTSPSTALYNDYELDEPLKLAAIEETRLFVAKLIADDLPAKNIVDARFTFLNERLANHYQIPGVQGAQMRYVALPDDSLRGGLLTQASVLKVTANGTTTSPVVRGNWITERILGVRIAPPPSVPAVEPDIRGAVTIRQQLEKHRADASCASCHAKIDPPGFALEAFDVMGGYRNRYRAINETIPSETGIGMNGQAFAFHYGLPADCAGTLADGSTFRDVREFKQLLLRDEKSLARNLANQLIIYATGAPITFSDREVIEQILDRSASHGWGVRTIIHAIVQSELFLNK